MDLDIGLITIRDPKSDDVEELHKLRNQMITEGLFTSQKKPISIDDEVIWLEKELAKVAAKRKVILVACDGPSIVATGNIVENAGFAVHIGTLGIWIAPSYRGKGLGTRMLTELEREARIMPIEKVRLSVRASNQAALALYSKSGYSEYGRLPDGLLVNEEKIDSILMYKDIK